MQLKLKTGKWGFRSHPKILPHCLDITLTADFTVLTDKSTDFHSIVYYSLLDALQEMELTFVSTRSMTYVLTSHDLYYVLDCVV